MTTVTIYGASDDLVEVEGDIEGADEFGCYDREWIGVLTDPRSKESLRIRAQFGVSPDSAWRIQVENTDTYPTWPFYFTERPDRAGDPAVVIDVPKGTVLTTNDAEDRD